MKTSNRAKISHRHFDRKKVTLTSGKGYKWFQLREQQTNDLGFGDSNTFPLQCLQEDDSNQTASLFYTLWYPLDFY